MLLWGSIAIRVRSYGRFRPNIAFGTTALLLVVEQIYCLDRYPIRVEQALMRRGISPPESYRIAAFDYETGEPKWQVNEGIFGSWLSYSEEFDLLLQAGAAASDRLTDEVSKKGWQFIAEVMDQLNGVKMIYDTRVHVFCITTGLSPIRTLTRIRQVHSFCTMAVKKWYRIQSPVSLNLGT